jgi:hypothetical protein
MTTTRSAATRALLQSLKRLSSVRVPVGVGQLSAAGRSAYVKVTRRDNWKRLESAASRIEARQGAMEVRLLRSARLIAQQRLAVSELEAKLRSASSPFSSRPEWLERREALRAELVRRGKPAPYIARAVREIGSSSGSQLIKGVERLIALRAGQVEAALGLCLRGRSGSRLAKCVADLNRNPAGVSSASTLLRRASAIRARIRRREEAQHASLRKGRLPAVSGIATLQADLVKAVNGAAFLASARRSNPADERLGVAALAVAGAIRALLRHLALCDVLAVISVAGRESESGKAWIKAAQQLPFESAAPAAKRIALSDLARGPGGLRGGARIQTEGVIGPVKITHRAKKVISSAPILDSSGRGILIEAHHRKLDSAGMVEGAYARVVGEWGGKKASSLLLTRRGYEEAAKRDWVGWVTLRLRSIYEASPQGLDTEWSWELGVDGAGNQLRYGLWAANDRSPIAGGGL